MDADSSSSSRRQEPPQLNGRLSGEMERGEDLHKTSASSTPRPGRYKDKFDGLRERYDQVVAVNHSHHRDLETARARMKKIQDENELLLDALNLVLPTDEALFRHIVVHPHQQPLPPQQQRRRPTEDRMNVDPPLSLPPLHAPHLNGSSNGHHLSPASHNGGVNNPGPPSNGHANGGGPMRS